MRAAWLAYWFRPAYAAELGVYRALFFGGLFVLHLTTDFSEWATMPAFWQPTGIFAWFRIPLPSEAFLRWIQLAWMASLVLCAVGWRTRASTSVAAVLGLLLIGLPHNFGKVQHRDAAAAVVLLLMAFSRCGDGFSLDARTRRKDALSGEYGWPIASARTVFCTVFFLAGLNKLSASGLAWVTSDHLLNVLLVAQHPVSNGPILLALGPPAAKAPWLAHGMAASALALELAAPAALFHRIAALALIPVLVLLLVGIRLTLGPSFEMLALCAVFWLPTRQGGAANQAHASS